MKKHIKKALALFMVSVALVSTLSWANAQSLASNLEYIPLEIDPEILLLNDGTGTISYSLSVDGEANLDRTEEAYDSLMRSFYEAQPDSQKYQEGCYTVNGITAEGFPEEYAGAYVNKDLNLVVLLTEDCTQTTHALSTSEKTIAQASNSEDVIYASAEYPYSQLVSIMNDIYQYMLLPEENKNTNLSISFFYIDDYNNCVTVGMENTEAESVAEFKKTISDSDAVTFIPVANVTSEKYAELHPGGHLGKELDNGIKYDYCTLGFRCYKMQSGTPTYGFVTAAHCYNPGEYVKLGDENVAIATSAWQYFGTLDAVFCQLLPNNTVKNTTAYIGDELKSAIDFNLAQGDPVRKYGCMTTTDGTVISTSIAYSTDNNMFNDFLLTTCLGVHGDSGGLVTSTRTGSNYIAGIFQGSVHYTITSTNQSGDLYVATKASNVIAGLGLTIY